MNITLRIFSFLFVLLITAQADEFQPLIEEANTLFSEANDLSATSLDQAQELYQKAALRYERALKDGNLKNGMLYYNLGNTYFQTGDLGRAILNYRRAELYEPNNPNLKQNLAFARQQRKDSFQAEDKTKALKNLLFLHYDLSFGTRFTVFSLLFITFWTAATVALFFKLPFLKWVLSISGALSVFFLLSLLASSSSLKSKQEGVIVENATARQGDSESYAPSFETPLHQGTEFTILEERPNWIQVRLSDDRECWLPTKSIETIL